MSGELDGALSRIIEAFAKIKASLRSLFEAVKEESERRSDEYKDLVARLDRISEKVIVISGQIAETRSDVKDITPPLGVPIYRPQDIGNSSNGSKKDGSGSALAIRDGKVKFALPASWVYQLLKVAMYAGIGAVLMRWVQWLVNKK